MNSQDLKTRLSSLPMVPLAGVDFESIPETTGICILRHQGKWAHISESDNLRRRIRQHAGTGQALSNSPLRKSLCVHLRLASPEEVKAGAMDKRTRAIEKINNWILTCDVGWLECDLADLADIKIDAIKYLKPILNKI